MFLYNTFYYKLALFFKGLVCFMRWLPREAYLDVQVIFTVVSYPFPNLCVLWEVQGLDRVVAIQLRFWKAKEPPTKWSAGYFRRCCSRSREALICLLTIHQSTHISKFLACLRIKWPYSESIFLHMIFLKDTCLFKSCFDVLEILYPRCWLKNYLEISFIGHVFFATFLHKFIKSRNNVCKLRDYSNWPG